MARHNIFGAQGEQAACDFLLKKGYIIRDRNWRCGKHELDIVAEKGMRIIIVEVKTRSSELFDLSKLIDRRKMMHLINGGKAYISAHKLSHELQFDIMTLVGSDEDHFEIEHLEDVFMPPMKTYR